MTLPRARNLYQRWYTADVYRQFAAAMDRVLIDAGLTDHYIARAAAQMQPHHEAALADRRDCTTPRLDIKDEVWGMIAVEGGTLALLNSPVMQRLRRIKQLGFSNLVYPSADHSRFSHSLGVYHVARRYAEEIGRRGDDHRPLAPRLEFGALTVSERLDLSHAALLHDIGHLPFSHATEAVFQSADTEFEVGGVALRRFKLPAMEFGNLALSEALSIAIILAPRFQRFYCEAVRPGDPDAPFRIALLVAGQPVESDNGALPELISSSIDADKIDYLLRDSRGCNIPIGIDVSRLFLRSAFVVAEPSAVPQGMAEIRPADRKFTLFCVNSSGIDTVEEVALARTVLYQRVYTHRVTRNIERLLAKHLFNLLDSGGAMSFGLHDALEMWRLGDEELLSCLQKAEQAEGSSHFVSALRLRVLPHRACAFGPALIEPLLPIESMLEAGVEVRGVKTAFKAIHGGYAELLKGEHLRGRKLQDLEDAVCCEAVRLRNLLARTGISSVPKGAPTMVTVLPLADLGKKQYTGAVLEPHGEIASAKDYTRIQQLMDAEEMGKLVGYVHSDASWVPLVALAFRSVIYDRYASGDQNGLQDGDLVFADRAQPPVHCRYLSRFRLDTERICRRARIDIRQIRVLQDELTAAGAYDEKPSLASPYNFEQATTIARRFRDFNGERGWRVTRDSVCAFLGQFPHRLRDEMADLLVRDDGVTFLDRSRIVTLLDQAIRAASLDAGGRRHLVPLSPNSGNLVRMLFEQDRKPLMAERGWTVGHSLAEALGRAKSGDTIILCDDNVSSGSQARSQFLSWYGVPREQWPADLRGEAGVDDVTLSDNAKSLMAQLSIGIAVCVKGRLAEDELRVTLKDLLPKQFLGIFAGKSLDNFASTFDGLSDNLQSFLRAVGSSVLRHARRRDRQWANEQTTLEEGCDADALGYGGLKGMLVTPFNVPTSTLPALWCPGMVNGEPWMPLFVRRGYLRHLVVA